jgi:hypothetical protein
MKTMHATAPARQDKPLVISGREIMAAGRVYLLSHRCGTHGGKGRKTRNDVSRRVIREGW